MRIIIWFFFTAISFNSLALDAYSSATKSQKDLVKGIMKELKIPENKDIEAKIYNKITYLFDDRTLWSSYWLGYGDLASSKFKEQEVTYIEQLVNTEKNGVFFISFLYNKKISQILINRKQIRYGTKKTGLNLFKKLKEDETNKVNHEKDSYALIQKKKKVDFTAINTNVNSAVVVYFDQATIDI